MGSLSPYAKDFGPFDGRVWLNTAHQGPLPKLAVDAAKIALTEKVQPQRLRDEAFFDVPLHLRTALGRLIGASPEDIILGNSTTYGLDLLANGMRWSPGDEILLVDGDFPADVLPWLTLQDQGVTVRFVEPRSNQIEAQQLAEAFTPHTRIFCTSWVNSFTGWSIDLDSIGETCRRHSIIFVLNASQALGARALDVQMSAVDAVTCCGFKWLCGPYATGFCWLTPSLRESLVQRHAYWLTMQTGKPLDQMREYSLRTDLGARAWDVFCTANFLNFVPWTAALEYLLQIGMPQISAYDQHLVEKFLEQLDEDRFELISPRSWPQRSTLIVLRPKAEEAAMWHSRLSAAGFDIAMREGNLRISPHLYNSEDEMEMLCKEIMA